LKQPIYTSFTGKTIFPTVLSIRLPPTLRSDFKNTQAASYGRPQQIKKSSTSSESNTDTSSGETQQA
jgi:hypothetical protein